MHTFSRRVLAGLTMGLALSSAGGALVLLAVAPLGSLALAFYWTDPAVLAWDAGLSFVFFLQHSGMIRLGYRERLSQWIGPEWHGALYAIASGVALCLVVFLWQNTSVSLLTLRGPARLACQLCALAAVSVFLWGVYSLRTTDFFGIRALRASLRDEAKQPLPFVVAGPYRWVRHPLYSCVLVMLWVNPDLTLDSLLFRVLWSAWVVLGTRLEERDLVRALGEPYRDYQRRVPMLVPWPKSPERP